MKILTSPDPLLRQVCAPVEVGDARVKRLSKQMLREMYRSDGVGLAAPQVGELMRLVVIDTDYVCEDANGRPLKKNPLVFVNPQIVEHSEERELGAEGCLSLPGISVEVERWSWVRVECLDEDFRPVTREGDGLFGRCMQHELDHLDGITLFERLDGIERMQALEAYREAQERGARPGDVGAE